MSEFCISHLLYPPSPIFSSCSLLMGCNSCFRMLIIHVTWLVKPEEARTLYLGCHTHVLPVSYRCRTGRFHVIIFNKLLMSPCLCFLGYTIFLLNGFKFKLFECSTLESKSFFLYTLFEWSVIFSHFSCSSLLVLLDRCNFGS